MSQLKPSEIVNFYIRKAKKDKRINKYFMILNKWYVVCKY